VMSAKRIHHYPYTNDGTEICLKIVSLEQYSV
jgi:hypothetical protein